MGIVGICLHLRLALPEKLSPTRTSDTQLLLACFLLDFEQHQAVETGCTLQIYAGEIITSQKVILFGIFVYWLVVQTTVCMTYFFFQKYNCSTMPTLRLSQHNLKIFRQACKSKILSHSSPR